MMKPSKTRLLTALLFVATFSLTVPAAYATTSIINGENLLFNSDLELDLGGLTPGTEHDQILATGVVGLGGTLNILLIDGWVPSAGDLYTLILAEQIVSLGPQNQFISPSFAQVNYPALLPGLNFLLDFNLDPSGQDAMVLRVTSVPLPAALWMLAPAVALLMRRRNGRPGAV